MIISRGARSRRPVRTAERKVGASAQGATVRLKLDRALRRGRYTVKVIAVRGARQTVQTVALKA
jgi:hypothetical protein